MQSDSIVYIFAIIGSYWVLFKLLIPTIDAMLYATGATIFYMLHIKWNYALLHPLTATKSIIKIYFSEMRDGTMYVKKSDYWIWKPYFHYKRRKRKDIR